MKQHYHDCGRDPRGGISQYKKIHTPTTSEEQDTRNDLDSFPFSPTFDLPIREYALVLSDGTSGRVHWLLVDYMKQSTITKDKYYMDRDQYCIWGQKEVGLQLLAMMEAHKTKHDQETMVLREKQIFEGVQLDSLNASGKRLLVWAYLHINKTISYREVIQSHL